MPFSFLAPAFLAGLAVIAVPVILHLVNRPKDRVVEFPSLMFLDATPYPSSTRRRLRNPLLLLLRCLALAAVVAAFARPAFDRPPAAVAALGGREVVIMVDRSYSMAYGERADRALDAARSAVASLGSGDRATIVFFDDVAAAATRATDDRAELLAALDTFAVGAGTTRYGPALELAATILSNSDRPRGEVVMISDFQAAGWNGRAPVRLPPGATVTPVAIGDGEAANRYVASVSFRSDRFSGRDRVGVAARVVHRGSEPVRGLPVTLELDGRALGTRRIDLPANGAATITFDPVTVSDPYTRGTIHLPEDALARDDAFHFVLSPDEAISVLILDRIGSGPGPSLYLRRALNIGATPGFRIETANAGGVNAADFGGHDVVILNAAPFPDGAAGRRLQSWVRSGGGLVVVMGDADPGIPDELLPGDVGGVIVRGGGRGGSLASIEYDHEIFGLFRTTGSGDFAAARFFRYREFSPARGAAVLARFDDGAVALAERTFGRGRVLVWTSTLDASWNDLALQPVFLPFVHRLARHAAGFRETPAWRTVGDLLDLRAAGGGALGAEAVGGQVAGGRMARAEAERSRAGSDIETGTGDAARGEPPVGGIESGAAGAAVLLAPSGARIALGSGRGLVRFAQQGFYTLRDPGAPTARPRTFAVNLDVAESDLSAFDPAELASTVAPPENEARAPATAAAALPGAASDSDERARRQIVWWFLLAVAVALFASETVLSNRLAQSRTGDGDVA